jgi:phosphate-selective porin OprO/OprP
MNRNTGTTALWALLLLTGAVPIAPRPARAEETIEDVDQRLHILERLQELEKEKAADKAKDAATVGAGKDGFLIKSADGSFQLRLRGLVDFDGRFWGDDVQKPQTDTFLLRRARPIVEATVYSIYDFRIVPDFGEGKTLLQDAYAEARFRPFARVRAGKFKTPFGLERLQSASDILFVERALPTNLVPNRDIGIQVAGDLLDGVFSYAVGAFNGVPDGSSADADTNDSKDTAARLFVQPFKKTSIAGLQGLGIGLAATRGTNRGTPTVTGLATYKTPGQQNFFTYLTNTVPTAANTVVGDGRRARLSPQLYYCVGRFGLLGEYVKASQEVRIDTSTADLEHESWQVTASFLLTADKASFKGVSPKKPFGAGVESTGAGAIELVGRYGRLTIDRDTFPTFASPTASPEEATEKGFGVNWYLNRNVKAALDYVETSFVGGGGAPGVDREDEKVLLSRFQVSF